ncbi:MULTISPECIES: pirin family protein [Methylocaldum]|jgi:redox-sensitive bicupin YhaK (pirin superfamily)|uniref:pirin family protein n=1 Tax=unclassified Methylocaldum TaxID=2622260 RepID=UPI00098B7F8D|nr:pirin family protein [Methylocaldum sp. 14B]MDV3241411.1 pirin family protein [Methylocaldum sp.]
MTTSPNFVTREVERLVTGNAVSDGAGVKLLRVLTPDLQRRLDPFLMLDEFRSDNPDDYLAGFPDHPHRGFETVTYMLAGRMRHRDNAGHEGLLAAGGVQWMTAGRGIIHSELPEQEQGLMHGFQLWINLPAREKMTEPGYRDISAEAIPSTTTAEGVTIRIIAGSVAGIGGAVRREATEPLYLDLEMPAGSAYEAPIPGGHNAFLYVYEGEVGVGTRGEPVRARQLAVLTNRADADGVRLTASRGARSLLVAGRPLNEPIVQWGPFVMNTRDEVEQAMHDFRSGKF